MSQASTFEVPGSASGEEVTGRYIVTFRDEGVTAGLAALRKTSGVARLASAADFSGSAIDVAQLDKAGGAVFPTLGVAVVTLDEEGAAAVASSAGAEAAILGIEPERMFYALEDGLSKEYLDGYRDAVNHLHAKATGAAAGAEAEALARFADDARSTWGLKATRGAQSASTGNGIRVAILDTGFDLRHPDFRGRPVSSKSFIAGQTVQDGHGHGTHCVGTSCGLRDQSGRRYGMAPEASIHVGKVLSNGGSGATAGILAGMEWAVVNKCQVISMSLGNAVTTPSPAYENVARRALVAGTLIVAAAGNHRTSVPNPPGTVGQPANSPSVMAVAALDGLLRLAPFSCTSGPASGANVDIAAPGVAVYSSTKMPARYATWDGTSMATPHVAGAAALWAQASGARGWRLWQLLVGRALRLRLPAADVGAGLVLAP